MDGTLCCETDPGYFDHKLLYHRVMEDPDYKDQAIDATYIQRYAIWMPTPITNNYQAADTDEDGFVTIMDATMTQYWLANSVTANENIGKQPLKSGQEQP